MSPFIPALALAMTLAASAVSAAEPVFKSIMPDGRVVYGESPMPGAKRVDKVATPPEHAGVSTISPGDKARAESIPAERAGVAVIPQPQRPPVQPATQGYSANPTGNLTNRRY